VAQEDWPWLILTDTRMPRLDGFELCRRLRADALLRRTPVLFLSGWDDYEHQLRGLAAGADQYVSKATPLRLLLVRVLMLLKRYSDLGAWQRGELRGSLDLVGPFAALRIAHLAQLSGALAVREGARVIEVRFRAGEIVGADSDRTSGGAALTELLGLLSGEFEFVPGEPAETVAPAPFDELLRSAAAAVPPPDTLL
jgi:CheY-like chemotaxis protein